MLKNLTPVKMHGHSTSWCQITEWRRDGLEWDENERGVEDIVGRLPKEKERPRTRSSHPRSSGSAPPRRVGPREPVLVPPGTHPHRPFPPPVRSNGSDPLAFSPPPFFPKQIRKPPAFPVKASMHPHPAKTKLSCRAQTKTNLPRPKFPTPSPDQAAR